MEQTHKLKSGNILKVIQDSNSESPDTWGDQDIFLVYNHRDFTIKRNGFEPRDIYDHLKVIEPNKKDFNDKDDYQLAYNDYAESINLDYNNYYIFLVYAYIHSGVSLSLDNATKYPWDVSSNGYVLVKKSMIEEGLITPNENHKEHKAKEYAEGLIKIWNQYLSGDVWGFQILKLVKTYTITEEELLQAYGQKLLIKLNELKQISTENIEYEEIDSCYGFYGSDIKINGILDHINDEIIE